MMPFPTVALCRGAVVTLTQFGVLAYLGADAALASAVGPVNWDAESYDTTGWHDNVTNNSRLTIPSGVSLVRPVGNANLATGGVFKTFINGSTYAGCGAQHSATAGDDSLNVVGAIVAVSAGNYVELYKDQVFSTTIYADRSWLGVEVIDGATRYALVNKTSGQAIGASTTTTLTWDNEVADIGGWHDNATNNSRLTIPSGVSLVRISCSVINNGSTTGQNVLTALKNGSAVRGLPARDVELTGVKGLSFASAVLEVTAGDYFEAQFFGASAETVPNDNAVWFQIEEVPTSYKRALVYKSGGQSLSAGVWTILAFGAEVYDTDSIHDNSTNNSRLTIPSGVTRARLSFNVKNPSTTGQLIARVVKNGSGNVGPGLPGDETDTAGTDNINGFGAWVDVTPGDFFELEAFSSSAVTLGTDTELWFSIECQ